jgi:hypothetical protein
MAKLYDISIKQGSTFKLVVDVTENGVIKNLTGYSGRMKIRPDPLSATTLADLTAYVNINSPTQGQLTVTVPPAITAAYTWNTGVYDLEVFTASDADVISVLEGSASLKHEVTR